MPSKNLLTPVNRRSYSRGVAETTATGFGDLLLHTADDHRQVVFLHPQPLRVLFNGRQWWGCLRACRFPYAPVRQPCYLPLTRLATGSGVTTAYGGRTMLRHIHARPEQASPPNILTEQKHPLFAYAGRNAAELWLLGAPLSMADFRDLRFRNLVAGDTSFAGDSARREAFNDAFANEIALSIARQSRLEVQS
jgi:hypothetical protein